MARCRKATIRRYYTAEKAAALLDVPDWREILWVIHDECPDCWTHKDAWSDVFLFDAELIQHYKKTGRFNKSKGKPPVRP